MKKPKIKKKETPLQESIKELVRHLNDDEDYFYAWQSNIAMAFKDKYYFTRLGKNKRTMSNEDIHEIANQAAINFLKLLMKEHYKKTWVEVDEFEM